MRALLVESIVFSHTLAKKTYSTYMVYVVEYYHKMNEIVRISFKEEKDCENIAVAFEAKFVDAINELCRIHRISLDEKESVLMQ